MEHPPLSPPQRPTQFSLWQVLIVVTMICVWFAAYRWAGGVWLILSYSLFLPLLSLVCIEHGLRTKQQVAIKVGVVLLFLSPFVICGLAAWHSWPR